MITVHASTPLMERTRRILRQFPLLRLFYMLPEEAAEKMRLSWVPRNPVAFVADEFCLQLYNSRTFPKRLMNVWGDLLWPRLEIRGGKRHFTSNDPMRLLIHDPDAWIEVLADMGYDLEHIVTQTIANNEIPYRSPEEADEFLSLVGKCFWTHPNIKAGKVYEIVCKNRTHQDFSWWQSYPKIDFHRKYNHTQNDIEIVPYRRFRNQIEQIAEVNFDIEDVDTPEWMNHFFRRLKQTKDVQIVKLLFVCKTQEQIAQLLGYANHSGVNKRIGYIREEMRRYLAEQEKAVYHPPEPKPSTVKYDVIPFSYKRTQ